MPLCFLFRCVETHDLTERPHVKQREFAKSSGLEFALWSDGHGSKSEIQIVAPVNIRFNPTTKTGFKMGGEFTYPQIVLTTTAICCLKLAAIGGSLSNEELRRGVQLQHPPSPPSTLGHKSRALVSLGRPCHTKKLRACHGRRRASSKRQGNPLEAEPCAGCAGAFHFSARNESNGERSGGQDSACGWLIFFRSDPPKWRFSSWVPFTKAEKGAALKKHSHVNDLQGSAVPQFVPDTWLYFGADRWVDGIAGEKLHGNLRWLVNQGYSTRVPPFLSFFAAPKLRSFQRRPVNCNCSRALLNHRVISHQFGRCIQVLRS